jgi:hypothetical protein
MKGRIKNTSNKTRDDFVREVKQIDQPQGKTQESRWELPLAIEQSPTYNN